MTITENQTIGENIKSNIKECSGCSACANICPVNAIKMTQDSEGFYKPVIDEDKCIFCGACLNICPVDNNKFSHNEKPKVYAAMADDNIRKISSSGGAFSIIANEILEENGIVCGAAFGDNWRVEHIIVDNKKDLSKLRKSKYVQSYISDTLYKELKRYLDENKKVLFTGVPCQVAGLLNYLQKDYPNLYTIDLICAYAPSPKVFEMYLKENFKDEEIQDINFRDKENTDWNCSILKLKLKLKLKDNSIIDIYDKKYMQPYLDRLFKGSQCESCKFKKFPRPGDFTIGDFWKIDKFTPNMNDKKGTSAILLNSTKSEELFNKIKNKFSKLKEMPFESAAWQIDVKHKILKTPACKKFFEDIDVKPYNQNIKEAVKETNVGITNWWFVNNRGAILTNYALNEMVKSLGYNALTINYVTPFERKNFSTGFAKEFAEKYLQRTRWINTKNDLTKLNEDIGTFICGSDQIFRYFPCKVHGMLYYFPWVDADINKLISYSASFAVHKFEADKNQTTLVKHYLNRFDYHSVREYDGVDIMRDTFNIDCQQVLDPVFCIDKQKYLDLAEKSTDKLKEDFIAYYIMWPTKENLKIVEHIKKLNGVKKAVHLNPPMSVENWLWYIINAKFIVTDSFHATCFSMIFNKQFAAIPREIEYPSRFKSLDELSGLHSRFFYNNKSILTDKNLLTPIDYTEYNKKIAIEKDRSIEWLKKAITTPKTKQLTEEQRMYDAIIQDYNEIIDKRVNEIRSKITKPNTFIENLFSIKTERTKLATRKIITILGIKIKIRQK